MEVFAIKHKPTNTYMPAQMFSAPGSGWTHWEPGEVGKQHGLDGHIKGPRIFFTRQSAQNALTAWMQGPMERKTGRDGDWETGYFDVDIGPGPINQPLMQPRVRADMEIVSMLLTESVGA